MTEEKQSFIRNLMKENNSLVQSLLKPCAVGEIQPSLDWITSFEKLIRIIQGLPCDGEQLSVEVALLYNYLLVLRPAAHLNASISLGSLSRNVPGNCCLRLNARAYKTAEDVLHAFVSRVDELNGDRVVRTSATDEQKVLSKQLIKLLLSISFPGSVKATLLQLAVAYCLRLLDCQFLKEAAEMSLQMFEQVLPRVADVFQIESVDPHLQLPHICSERLSAANVSVLTDSVRVVSAVSSFRLFNWNSCLTYMRQTTTFPLKLYCLYAEGYVLYQQKAFETAFGLLSELIKRLDLSHELSRNVRNLIGCCLSSQGKHRSAIQVFKKCLQDNFLFPLPLYNITLQYRKLLLFDAEIETLQLLAKLLESDQCSNRSNDYDILRFDGKSSSLARYQPICRRRVLHLLARRCLDLERYTDAVCAYQELMSHLSSVGSSLDAGATDYRLPPVTFLYSQMIFASIRAKKFDETVALCDVVLSKGDSLLDELSNNIPSQRYLRPFPKSHKVGDSTVSELKAESVSKANLKTELPRATGKRLREEDEGEHVAEDGAVGAEISQDATYKLFDAAILLYKAEALVNLDQRSDSLLCVNQAISILELSWLDTDIRNEEEPCHKKIKIGSSAEGDEQPCVWRQMLSDAYSMKSLILVTLDQTQNAVHWSRLAYQLNNSDAEKAYNLSLLLYKLQRNNEASSFWLSHRDLLAVSHDSLQLVALLKRCSANLGKLTKAEATSREGRYCTLDVEALKILRTVKHRT